VTALQIGFVFEDCDELPPRNILFVAGVSVALKQTLDGNARAVVTSETELHTLTASRLRTGDKPVLSHGVS